MDIRYIQNQQQTASKLTSLTTFLKSNQLLLEQVYRELSSLTDTQSSIFAASLPFVGGASIGAHLRHILDFYSAFYYGLKKGHIDYDDRQRNPQIEGELKTALQKILIVIEQLDSLGMQNNREVTIHAAIDVMGDDSIGHSNVIRELQSLHSHTTHHMAIIAIALKLHNIDVEDNFGKAPSTIQYENAQKSPNQPISQK